MSAVEDGEILELDHSEAPPNPPHQSPPDVSRPRINPYRGGDPFLGAQRPTGDVLNHVNRFSRFPRSSVPYRHDHTRSASLNDLNLHLHSPALPVKPRFERDPYATNSTPPSAEQQSIPEPSNVPTLSHSFPVSTPSNDPRATSLPNLPSSHELTWPRSAPPDPPPSPFRGPSGAQILNPPNYSHDPEAYSPTADQSLFCDRPVYHAEPAPPSFYYARQHPLVPPSTAGVHQTTFDVPLRGQPHLIHSPHEGASGAIFTREPYTGGITKEPVFRASDPISPANDFHRTSQLYQAVHDVESPRHQVVETKVQEDDDAHNQRSFQAPCLDISSKGPGLYNQQYMVGSHQRPISETFAAEGMIYDSEGSEEGRVHQEQRMSSLSNGEDQRAKPDDDRGRGNGHGGEPSSRRVEDGDISQRNANEEKNGIPLQDEASDGEIGSSRVTSPVVSVATVPEESPSPPSSTKKKPSKLDAKKHLYELRRKALMSVKKRPSARSNNENVEPGSPRTKSSAGPVTNTETVEGPQIVQTMQTESHNSTDSGGNLTGAPDRLSNVGDELASEISIQLGSTVQVVIGGVRKTMTRKQFDDWQAWPYQNRVLVDYSSDSSNGDNSDVGNEKDDDNETDVTFTGEVRRSGYRNRESEIEAMKIRMIRLGKCPSILFGGSKSSNESKNSSSSVSIEKSGGLTVQEREEKITEKECTTGEAPHEVIATVRQAGQGKQSANSKRSSLPKRSDASELTVSNLSAAPDQSDSAVENKNDTNVAPLSQQKASTLCPAENRSVLDLEMVSEHIPSPKPGNSRKSVVQEGKYGSQLQNREATKQRMESLVPMKSSTSATGTDTASPIAELKRRIAAIEKTRDSLKQQRQKKRKTGTHQDIRVTDRTTTDSEHRHLPHNATGGTEAERKLRISKAHMVERCQGGMRYYSSGTSDTMQAKNLAQGLHKRNEEMDIDSECQESISDGTETKKLPISEKQDMETAFRLPDDSAERRYIDDLKLELEQKTKELMNERDRTEQLRIAEIAIAEAKAKLDFTRSRVSSLQDELQKAEQDVVDAEKECRQRSRVVAQLRLANSDGITDTAPGQEGPTSDAQFIDGVDSSVLSTSVDMVTESDCEEDARQEEEKVPDFVLRLSPYSPSVGDNFTSCLRALRAYASVTQHMSSAARYDTKKSVTTP